MHINGVTIWVRWLLWCCEVRCGFLPSTQEGLFRVVPATFPGKHEHLTVWERSSMRFLLQHRCAAMTSHVPPSVDADTHTHMYISGTYEILYLWPIKRCAYFSLIRSIVSNMTCIRNTHFSNTHQTFKQISDKYTFLRSTVSEEKKETACLQPIEGRKVSFEPLASNIWQKLSSKRSLICICLLIVYE